MPRNDQVTRQWYLLRELDSGKGLTPLELRRLGQRQIWHPSQEPASQKDGRLKLGLRVADTAELSGWLLSFGSRSVWFGPSPCRQRSKRRREKFFARDFGCQKGVV